MKTLILDNLNFYIYVFLSLISLFAPAKITYPNHFTGSSLMFIQAVFWDYDNTILATAEAHWKKHQTVLAGYGIQLNEQYRNRIYENNGYQNWQWITQELHLNIPEKEYLKAIDEEFQKYMINLEMRPGVDELFEFIQNLGLPQGIVTNARKNSAYPVLKEKKILSFMQLTLFKEDYEGRKPDPTPYLTAFEKMGSLLKITLDPKRCLVIEDDPLGVESAHQAGATVFHRTLHEKDNASPYADYSCYHTDIFVQIIKKLLTK